MRLLIAIFAAFALMVPGAMAQKVKVDFDQTRDFTNYRTYAWQGCKALNNDAVMATGFAHQRIREAVNNQLTLKEMVEVAPDQNPDVYFTCIMGSADKTEVWSSGGPGWYGPRWGWYGGWGHTSVHSYNYTENTIVIDMVDADTEQLVWRAHSTSRLDNSKKDVKKIDNIAKKAFKKFPPATKGNTSGQPVAAD